MVIQKNHCIVCNENKSKYKCPACSIKYCSLQCFKNHKKSGCQTTGISRPELSVSISTQTEIVHYEYETEDTVKPERLKLLENDTKLKNILRNPHLRNMLKGLMLYPDPAYAMEQAMKEPIFIEYAEKCLELVEPGQVEK